MTAHIFYFKWPRIQEDLVHEVHEGPSFIETIKAPRGAYIYTENGEWYQLVEKYERKPGSLTYIGRPYVGANRLQEHQVPKLIRLHMLLLM